LMIKMPLIQISEENKTALDSLAVDLAKKQEVKSVTYDEAVGALIRYFKTGTVTEVKE
jgi:hypothetical protein